MASLLDLNLSDDSPEPLPFTEEVRFGEPATIRLFTPEYEAIDLHYEKEEEHRGHYGCLGPDCPTCQMGSPPTRYLLLPVYDYAGMDVRPMRMIKRTSAGALLPQIQRLLLLPEIDKKIVVILRKGFRYQTELRDLPHHAEHGEVAIKQYVDDHAAGHRLVHRYSVRSREEILEIDRIRRKLIAMGKLSDRDSMTGGGNQNHE